jgi:organic hydroperoxide reductase OsmC/OhrA
MLQPEKILYHVEVTVTGGRDDPGVEKSLAEEVVAGAHERCPYSKATRGNIDVKLTVL